MAAIPDTITDGTKASYLPAIDAETEIRLIEFLRTKTEDDIACRVTVHKLSEVQDDYSAISYVWGKPTPTTHISINGVGVDVRRNCWRSLWQVKNDKEYRPQRFNIRNHPRKLVWIDSICIDQRNDSEKSCQVQLMADIYSGAHTVLACLGSDGLKISKNMTEPDRLYKAWRPFLFHSYFTRVWILQECVLAKKLHVLIGRQRDDMLALRAMLFDFTDASDEPALLLGNFLHRVKGSDNAALNDMDLAALIVKQCEQRDCYNPRDMVYGLLGLVPEAMRQRISLDYSKTLARVLLDYSCAYDFLDNSRTLASNWSMINAREKCGAIYTDLLLFWAGFRRLFKIYRQADAGFVESLMQMIQAALPQDDHACTPKCPWRPVTLDISSGDISVDFLRIDTSQGLILEKRHTVFGNKTTLFFDAQASQSNDQENSPLPIDVPNCVSKYDVILRMTAGKERFTSSGDENLSLVFRPPSCGQEHWQLLGVAGLVAPSNEDHYRPRARKTFSRFVELEDARVTLRLHPAILVVAFMASMRSHEYYHLCDDSPPCLDLCDMLCEVINFPGIGPHPPVGQANID